MSAIVFEGPAGTGKTTQLMAELERQLTRTPLNPGQRVLGLTFMHGSRRQLKERLGKIRGLGGRFECSTFDSFAWRLVQRWRSLVNVLAPTVDEENEYDRTCSIAATLLARKEVQDWVARAFPLVIVDEVQDCRRGRLGIIQGLDSAVTLLVAGDGFQDLGDLGPNQALEWLEATYEVTRLDVNHRTDSPELLTASSALRRGEPIHSGRDFQVFTAYQAANAAGHVARSLTWKPQGNVVILSPTKPANSGFVRETIDRLEQGKVKVRDDQYVGPFTIRWELDSEALEASLFEAVGLVGDPESVIDPNALDLNAVCPGATELKEWVHRRRCLGRPQHLKVGELQSQARKILQRLRAYGSTEYGLKAMTIHQAKNREFSGVIVLWPYKVGGSDESLRRRLYNAVTRARKWVTVIVQDPHKVRLTQPPFA